MRKEIPFSFQKKVGMDSITSRWIINIHSDDFEAAKIFDKISEKSFHFPYPYVKQWAETIFSCACFQIGQKVTGKQCGREQSLYVPQCN